MTILERFLKYISIDTTSSSLSDTNPSTKGQHDLAKSLVKELKNFGLNEITYDKNNCYIYAVLRGDPQLPKIGFISHLDTSEDANGKDINAQLITDYDGEDIKFDNGKILDVKTYPNLRKQKGKTLITTDGTSLLGSDDKAGITEIMTMLEHFSKTRDRHGDIYVCFTPDEEIGKGMDKFNLELFPVTYAYTVDGSTLGELSYENFNAATAYIEIEGTNSHTGYAKGVMTNSLLIANAIISSLPEEEIPSLTENYEGFYHLETIKGDVNHTKLRYLIRDFDKNNFEKRKQILEDIVKELNKKYENRISIKIEDTYMNMKNIIEKDLTCVDIVTTSMKNIGIEPTIIPIRGGTDGADLTEMGIPCPNIGTGGHNFHSIYEYIALEDMEKTTDILISIVKEASSKKVLTKKEKKDC